MYLLATHIPIHVVGRRLYLDRGWFPDVVLARDWLARPFGQLVLLAPWTPLQGDLTAFEEITPEHGVRLVPVFDDRCRARRFWLREALPWREAVRRELGTADVLHTGMDDLYRPMSQMAFRAAVRAGVPTVLVGPDMDVHEVWADQIAGGPWKARLEKRLYVRAFDWAFARHLGRADLSLLKEGAVHDRYARFALNPRAFCHTMYSLSDVVSEEDLERRLAGRSPAEPLRLVYCGRLVHRKGLHVSLEIVERLRDQGAPVRFDVIGSGPEEDALRRRAEERGLGTSVQFCGPAPYGPQLLRRLSGYDALLFTPTEEDTPRMLYDAYAAGLPFVGAAIPFVRHRASADEAGTVFPVGDAAAGAREVAALWRTPARLDALSRRARQAGLHHAVERWYGRRATWTVEAVERRRAGAPAAASAP
jgi:glycosyltransferase involved in cell wall biosynthesis